MFSVLNEISGVFKCCQDDEISITCHQHKMPKGKQVKRK